MKNRHGDNSSFCYLSFSFVSNGVVVVRNWRSQGTPSSQVTERIDCTATDGIKFKFAPREP
jgi:hypothetical protein